MSREAGRSIPPPFFHPHRADSNRPIDPSDVQSFWTNIHASDIGSSEHLSEVQSLLNSPSTVALARSYQGREAQSFIDYLHQVSYPSRVNGARIDLSCGGVYRSLSRRISTIAFGGGACGLSARYPKHRGFYPCRISCEKRTYTLGRFATRGGLVSSAMENTRETPWPSSTSRWMERTPTRFSG